MKISRKKFIISASGLLTSAFLFDSLWYEQYFFEENHYSLRGKGNNPLKILQLSDLHLTSIGRTMKKLAKRVTSISPDLIIITGDSIDNKNDIHLLDEFLAMLPLSVPKTAILGNWEHMCDVHIPDLQAAYLKHNGHLLINQNLSLKLKEKTIIITGIDEYTHGKPDFEKAVKDIEPGDLHIALCHSPGYIDIIRQKLKEKKFQNLSIDYVFSGHTHGGQINLLGFTPYLPYGSKSYLKGWYREHNPPMYVSKGIGTTILPIRFGAQAEIAIFTYG
jgi:predicted MPP superfamily phosphohydrolase